MRPGTKEGWLGEPRFRLRNVKNDPPIDGFETTTRSFGGECPAHCATRTPSVYIRARANTLTNYIITILLIIVIKNNFVYVKLTTISKFWREKLSFLPIIIIKITFISANVEFCVFPCSHSHTILTLIKYWELNFDRMVNYYLQNVLFVLCIVRLHQVMKLIQSKHSASKHL